MIPCPEKTGMRNASVRHAPGKACEILGTKTATDSTVARRDRPCAFRIFSRVPPREILPVTSPRICTGGDRYLLITERGIPGRPPPPEPSRTAPGARARGDGSGTPGPDDGEAQAADLGLLPSAEDGNRTRATSLGIILARPGHPASDLREHAQAALVPQAWGHPSRPQMSVLEGTVGARGADDHSCSSSPTGSPRVAEVHLASICLTIPRAPREPYGAAGDRAMGRCAIRHTGWSHTAPCGGTCRGRRGGIQGRRLLQFRPTASCRRAHPHRADDAHRCRFGATHELGHLSLHAGATNDSRLEREADALAAEFLTPQKTIIPLLSRRVDLAQTAGLSQTWGVSVSSLIYRYR
ncbi:ImmA/IrrE family metallo-endopeptidase [Streptomyces griseus]|uniref:ImmA/IrrE family metallo-endopeptidase n=1 Tax=Streptomyces griseus TaxID=1911 RepID=UPI002D219D68|nr:ImmA/IrrE family metallo-endopeptidase [Streptomyces griseus]